MIALNLEIKHFVLLNTINPGKKGEKMKLTKEDMGNLFDLYFLLCDNEEFIENLKLNRMDEWWEKFFIKLDEEVIQKRK